MTKQDEGLRSGKIDGSLLRCRHTGCRRAALWLAWTSRTSLEALLQLAHTALPPIHPLAYAARQVLQKALDRGIQKLIVIAVSRHDSMRPWQWLLCGCLLALRRQPASPRICTLCSVHVQLPAHATHLQELYLCRFMGVFSPADPAGDGHQDQMARHLQLTQRPSPEMGARPAFPSAKQTQSGPNG